MHCHDGHDSALLPDSALEDAQESAPTLNSEPTAPIEDGWLDTASGAATSTVMEPNTDPVPCEARDSEVPDSLPDSEPPAPLCHAQYATLSKRNSKVPPRIDPHIETLCKVDIITSTLHK